MPEQGGPTVRGRRLAAELRRLREQSGRTGDDVGRELGWSASKISRIEHSRTGVRETDLHRLLDLYGVSGSRRAGLLALARESRKQNWVETITADFPAEYAAYLRAEAEATAVWNWEPLVVPGILQTEDYARAVMAGWQSMFVLPPAEVERRIRVRQARRQRLTGDRPLKAAFVMDESVLHRRFGSAAVMLRQLRYLAEATEAPNIDLRLLRLDGEHPVGTGSFLYLIFAQIQEVPVHDIVVMEHMLGSYYVENDETHKFRVAFERLRETALDPVQSRELIRATAREKWS